MRPCKSVFQMRVKFQPSHYLTVRERSVVVTEKAKSQLLCIIYIYSSISYIKERRWPYKIII
jgi:hypothetical protein